MAGKRDAGEPARWAVFLLVVVPLLPLEIVAFVLGVTWAVFRDCFKTGSKILEVWGDDA